MDITTALAAPDPDEPERPDAPYPPGPSSRAETFAEEQLRALGQRIEEAKQKQRRSELEPVVASLVGMTTELQRIADSLERTELEPVERTAEPTRLRLDIAGDFREQMRRWARTDPTGFGSAVRRMARIDDTLPADVLPDDTAGDITTAVRQRKAAEDRARRAEATIERMKRTNRMVNHGVRMERERAERAEATVARVRTFAACMRARTLPRSEAAEYAARLLAVLEEPSACTCTHAERFATCRATDTPKDPT
ncbi:hypothetical protein DMB38_12920 [Streptomyces sp. WAC 06738]|uniref:hypothetical protein n=1 Tax=Streptomyces sp. WAC 06738 TaxID=2203210 RepID=UPI000F70455F|nr:hypothetical protein [Streptomyces sp. WAC 06738]AZM46596.1 hypothetical protein DMB38_12920 [Streptomyces sp. WAC 06738]